MNSFATIPEPEWLTCPCGSQTNHVPCWECIQSKLHVTTENDRRESRLATIPAAYAWSRLDASELPKRVQSQEPLESLTRRILGAANVVFTGPAGAGKTSLAVACLRERMRLGGIYVSALRLGHAAIQHKAGDGESPYIDQATHASLALLDDVGSERNTAVNAVPQVIFQRHEASLPTWVTTGLTFPELQERYGDGIARRILEKALVVKLGKQS